MSNVADDVVETLVSRPLSAKQIEERRKADSPRRRLVVDRGQVVDETGRVIQRIPTQTTD